MSDAMPRLDEIAGKPTEREGFTVTDLGTASWATGKIREAQEAQARIREHADQLHKQITEWEQSASAQWRERIEFFKPLVRRWAEEHMHEYSKKKSLDLLSGMRIGFYAGSFTVVIDDEAEAINELKQYQMTDAIKVTESVKKSEVKKHIEAGLQFNTIRVEAKPETFYVKPTEQI